jgi:Cu-processing system ATP-binding protein
MLVAKDINKGFGKIEVLKGINFTANDSGIYAILGPNGSGKTTLIKSILGMVIPDKGEIEIDGESILGKMEYREHIDYLPQIANFPGNIRVFELIDMIKDMRPSIVTREAELIQLFEIEGFMKHRIANLSGGTKQKLNIVMALMFNSPLVILDEPTVGLDPVALIRLKDLLLEEKAKGKIILMTTHIINLVDELADTIVFILEGKIYFQGSKADLKTEQHEDNLERLIANLLSSHV